MEPLGAHLPRRPGQGRPVLSENAPAAPTRGPRAGNLLWRYRRLLFLLWLLLFTALAGVAYVLSRVPLPSEAAQAQTSFLTDDRGAPLATLAGTQNRVPVTIDQVPPVVIDAVVSTEDRHFFSHRGVDPIGVSRALLADLRGRAVQGGSTITQQYVKNAFVGTKRSLTRKLKEAVLAVKVERKFTKRQILERYLNLVYFGRGAYGIQAASHAYFGVDVSKLNLGEASYLACLIRSPETADPSRGTAAAARAKTRQAATLDAMVRDHKITPEQRAFVEGVPLTSYVLDQKVADPTLTDPSAAYYVDWVRRQLLDRYGESAVYGGGLRVQTTINAKLQDAAYQAVYGPQGLSRPGDPAGALVAIDDQGQVKALVGGRDFGTSKVDLALGKEAGGSGRQPGSTFKPFLLAETVKEGYTVKSTFPGPPQITLPKADNGHDYKVQNYDGEDAGPSVSLIDATAGSINTVYAQLEQAIGANNLVSMAHTLGVQSPLQANASLVLGTAEVSPLEMAAAYSTLANRGVRIDPYFVKSVSGAGGGVLDQTKALRKSVIDAHTADVVTWCLEQVVQRGTGVGAAFGHPVAGKTGTTSDYVDAWFIGFTPKLTVAVWMGYADSGNRSMFNVHGVPKVNGGSLPAAIFKRFMTAATADGSYVGSFPPAPNLDGKPVPASNAVLPSTTLSPTTSTTTAPASSTTTTSVGSLPTTTAPPPASTTTLPPGPTTTEPRTTTTRPPPTTSTTR